MPPLESRQTEVFLVNKCIRQCIIPAMPEAEQKKYGFPHAAGGASPGFKGEEDLYPVEKTENSLCNSRGCWYPP
jgi:hypothetical protein